MTLTDMLQWLVVIVVLVLGLWAYNRVGQSS